MPETDIDSRGTLAGLRILIAEDDWNLAQMLNDAFEAAGATVVAKSNSVRDGLRAFDQFEVDVLVADMNLKDGMADALIEAADEIGAGVVVITGFRSLPSDSDHLVDEWLEKPVEASDVVTCIARLCRRLGFGTPHTGPSV